MPIYVDPVKLTKEIKTHQQTGRMSELLVEMIYKMADGLRNRFSRASDPDDARHDIVVLYLKKYKKVKAESSCFNFLTTIFRNELVEQHRLSKRKPGSLPTGTPESGVPFETGWTPSSELVRPNYTDTGKPNKTVHIGIRKKRYEWRNLYWTREELAKKAGVSLSCFHRRLKKYGSVKRTMVVCGKPLRKKIRSWRGFDWTIDDLAKKAGISVNRMQVRLQEAAGNLDEAMKPRNRHPGRTGKGKIVTYQGQDYLIPALAKLLEVNHFTLRYRLKTHGWDADKAVEMLIQKGAYKALDNPPVVPVANDRDTLSVDIEHHVKSLPDVLPARRHHADIIIC